MTIDDLAQYLDMIPDDVFEAVPDIVAETATEYFKESFTLKEFDKNPWEKAKKPKTTGSLLVESGNLVNSIRPAVISRERVVISAGNDKVEYAKVHNEGFTGPVTIPAHNRKTNQRSVEVPEYTRKNGVTVKAHTWQLPGGEQQVSQHTINQNIPKRPFMGNSAELFDMIKERIDAFLQSIL
jgi:phage gpG-like protein